MNKTKKNTSKGACPRETLKLKLLQNPQQRSVAHTMPVTCVYWTNPVKKDAVQFPVLSIECLCSNICLHRRQMRHRGIDATIDSLSLINNHLPLRKVQYLVPGVHISTTYHMNDRRDVPMTNRAMGSSRFPVETYAAHLCHTRDRQRHGRDDTSMKQHENHACMNLLKESPTVEG